MAKKTGLEIQADIYNLLKGSALANGTSGKLYHDGMRPRDSVKEDVVVIYTYGFAEQVQTGVVTINAYVPDIAPFADNGVRVCNAARCQAVEKLAQEWADTLTCARSDYRFKLAEAIHTSHDDAVSQSFVVVKLRYEYITL